MDQTLAGSRFNTQSIFSMKLLQERAEMQKEREKLKSAHEEMSNQYQTQFDTLKKQNRTLLQRLEETQEELQEATKTGESMQPLLFFGILDSVIMILIILS